MKRQNLAIISKCTKASFTVLKHEKKMIKRIKTKTQNLMHLAFISSFLLARICALTAETTLKEVNVM